MTWFDAPYTGPYLLMLSGPRSYDPPDVPYAKGFRDNLTTEARLCYSTVVNAGALWNAAKLYFTLWQAPAGAGQTGPLPAAADRQLITPGAVYGTPSFFLYCGMPGNPYAGGSSYDDWILMPDFDATGRPVVRGLVAVGKAPSFLNAAVFPAESADPFEGSGGSSGFFRYANFELAANLGASEAHRGQLTAAQWAERSRAAGAEFGRDVMEVKGA